MSCKLYYEALTKFLSVSQQFPQNQIDILCF